MQFWTKLADAGVLVAPGWFFSTSDNTVPLRSVDEGHLRVSFSTGEVRQYQIGFGVLLYSCLAIGVVGHHEESRGYLCEDVERIL